MTDPISLLGPTSYKDDYRRPMEADLPARTRMGSGVLIAAEWRTISRKLNLSEREFQIVQGVFDDKKETEIARELSISAHTVHTYLGRLYRKLNISSRSQLIVRVFGEYVGLVGGRRIETT